MRFLNEQKSRIIFNLRAGVIAGFLLTATFGWCAFDPIPTGARAIGMGSAYTALVGDGQSLFWNPAGLANLTGPDAGSSYFQPFGLSELNYTVVYASTKMRFGAVGGGYIGHGDGLYSERMYSLGYARRFIGKMNIGAVLRAMRVSAEGYGDDSAVGIDVGIQGQPHPRLWLGLAAVNLNAPTIGLRTEALPQLLTVGAAYRLRSDVWLTADLRKDIELPLQVACGLEYKPAPLLALRLGGHNTPEQFAAGFGVSGPGALRKLRLDYAFQTHPTLGATHHLSIALNWGDAPKAEPLADEPALPATKKKAPPTVTEIKPVDLNTATLADLNKIPGVGDKMAVDIVAYRETHGPFQSIDDLDNVSGIGPKTLDKIRPYVFIK